MLIATAGHIDHGKTALVRALTGIETDRLAEERSRGISIELGFANWRPDADLLLSFIDVPGHERFLPTMLAGIGGADYALLVIAATEGVKPQTVEHLEALDLLGFTRGAIVLTKTDLCDATKLADVRESATALVAGTGLSGAAIHEVSVITGAGIAELASALIAAAKADAPAPRPGRHFRLAVDRAFSMTGTGTVVTGTVADGALAVGKHVILAPAGKLLRVRGLQAGGKAVERAAAGQRCAVNLAGIEAAAIHRGDWLRGNESEDTGNTDLIEAQVRLLPTAPTPLRQGTHVHLHIGTASHIARVLLVGGTPMSPGETAPVRLALDRPGLAVCGDRFVLRDGTGQRTIGGGRVGDPFPPPGRRRKGRAPVAEAFLGSGPAEVLEALLALPWHEVDLDHFARACDLVAGKAEKLAIAAGARLLGKAPVLALPAARIEAAAASLRELLANHHRNHPSEAGLAHKAVLRAMEPPLSAAAFAALLREEMDAGHVATRGALLHLPGHEPVWTPVERAIWRSATEWLEARGAHPFSLAELARETGCNEPTARALLTRRVQLGDVWKIADTRYLLAEHAAHLAQIAARLALDGTETLTAATFRDASGVGRNRTIEILEFFDRIGVTRRIGEGRQMKDGWKLVIGSGTEALEEPGSVHP